MEVQRQNRIINPQECQELGNSLAWMALELEAISMLINKIQARQGIRGQHHRVAIIEG